MSAGIDVYSAAMATWRVTSLGQERKGGSGTEGQTYMCEYRLILNTADPYWIFKIGLFCSDKYYYLIHSFDLLLFWFIELREYY